MVAEPGNDESGHRFTTRDCIIVKGKLPVITSHGTVT